MNSKTQFCSSMISTVTCLGFRNLSLCSPAAIGSLDKESQLFSRFHLSPTTTAIKRKTNKAEKCSERMQGKYFFTESLSSFAELFSSAFTEISPEPP